MYASFLEGEQRENHMTEAAVALWEKLKSKNTNQSARDQIFGEYASFILWNRPFSNEFMDICNVRHLPESDKLKLTMEIGYALKEHEHDPSPDNFSKKVADLMKVTIEQTI